MQAKLKNQIEIVSENEIDKATLKKIKSLLGDSTDVDTKVDTSRFKQRIEVTTASPASDDVIKKIKDIFGENTDIVTIVDDSIIGGIMVKTKEKLFDGTIKGQLNKLKQQFVN